MKRRRRHSLSGRLIGLFLLTGLALALVVRGGFQIAFEQSFRDLARPHVAEYVRVLLARIGHPPDIDKAAELARRLPLEVHLRGPGLSWSSDGTPPDLSGMRLHDHGIGQGVSVRTGRGDDGFLLVSERDGYRVILEPHGLEPARWAPLAVALTILGVLLVLALAYHGIRRLFRPLETVQAGLARIGGGDLDHRIQVVRKDELGELARSVNAMAERIRDMLEAKRQLLLAISHELRSPLTRARVNLALLPSATAGEALERDLAEMERLTEELLESERLNDRHDVLNLSVQDPCALAREVIESRFPGRGVRAEMDTGGRYVNLDPVRFKLLLGNLLDNALRHTPEGAEPPLLAIRMDEDAWSLRVRDHGTGMAAEHLARATEPFYRADPSRRRETGGYGLGLYLCRVIVEAHGGRLSIESREGEGTEVRALFVANPENCDPTH